MKSNHDSLDRLYPEKWALIKSLKPNELPPEVQQGFRDYMMARLDFEMALENLDAVLDKHFSDRPRLIDQMITAARSNRVH